MFYGRSTSLLLSKEKLRGKLWVVKPCLFVFTWTSVHQTMLIMLTPEMTIILKSHVKINKKKNRTAKTLRTALRNKCLISCVYEVINIAYQAVEWLSRQKHS